MIDTPHLLAWLRSIASAPESALPATLAALAAPNLDWHGPCPIGALRGLGAVRARFWQPFKHAFPDLERRDDIAIAGTFETGDWVATTGYYAGTWARDWLGFPPTGQLTWIRFGEFYRVEAGRVVEARVLLDVLDVLRQGGRCPLPASPGVDGLAPGPATHDGVILSPADPAETASSLRLVEDMIFGGLRGFDGADLRSMGMERFWTAGMMWYGPCGIGATRGVAGFERYHQRPFLHAFPDRVGGNHRARLAQGAYVASTGWPSIHATHQGDYLGHPATGRPITMVVMDWWRRDGDLLAENWVFIDLPHLFLQFGRDLLAEARAVGAGGSRPGPG